MKMSPEPQNRGSGQLSRKKSKRRPGLRRHQQRGNKFVDTSSLAWGRVKVTTCRWTNTVNGLTTIIQATATTRAQVSYSTCLRSSIILAVFLFATLFLHQSLPFSRTRSHSVEAAIPPATPAAGKPVGPGTAPISAAAAAAAAAAKLGAGDYQASSREIEKQIVDKILGEGYDKRIRPAGSGPYNGSRSGNDGPTIVKVNTLVRSISKIDDVTMEYSTQLTLRQEWTDDRLAFGKMAQYKNYGLNSITLTEQDRLWKPDLFFRNEKEGHFHKIIMPNVLLRIKGEGEVLYSIRISLVLACPMDLKYYPLDKQNCSIEMASYGYLDEDLKFIWKEQNPVQIAQPLNLPRFTLETHSTAYCTSITSTGAYSCLRIELMFKREFSYYLIQIYIPCCMLVIVSWVSFWLDPNAIPARVSLGVTTLLTMATQISGINASLPPVSYTKAIDVWTGVCLTFVFGALLEFALVNYASRSDQHKREMLNSALTHTQQMRWREASAAAAAAGVAPPTSPPPDENSPSALFGKQPAFFAGPFQPPIPPPVCALHHSAATANQGYHQLHHQTTATTNTTNTNSTGQSSSSGTGNCEQSRLLGTWSNQSTLAARANSGGGVATVDMANSSNNNTFAGRGSAQAGHKSLMGSGLNKANSMQLHQHHHNDHNKPPQINGNLNYLKSPRDALLMSPMPPKSKNWCKMWLAKFPTRSKRIDVISRIFFPLKFALFNLVYWTTYLFREDDSVVG